MHLILIIKNLTIKDLKNHSFIEDFSFSLGNYDKVGIIGEEGNGKTTLLKAIAGNQNIEDYMSIQGTIEHDRKKIGYVNQSLSLEWKEVFIWEYLLKEKASDEIEEYHHLKVLEETAIQLHIPLSLLQRDQKMKTLSGGEKVKLRILKEVSKQPDLLLLDEPSNDLDIQTLLWLQDFIKAYAYPILFISHDEVLLNDTANCIIHLEQRNKRNKCAATVFYGSYKEYIQQRYQKRQKELQVYKKEKQEYKKKKIKLNTIQNAVHDALNDCVRNPGQAALLEKKMRNVKAMEKRFDHALSTQIDSVEEAIDVYFEVKALPAQKIILDLFLDKLQVGERCLIEDINLLVKGQEKIAFLGENGCGKSVLLHYVYQQLKSRSDIRLGFMPQNYEDKMNLNESPIAFLLEADTSMKTYAHCRELLGRINFTAEEMTISIAQLSEGQKAKLYFLKFIKEGCNVLLLDEPTRNLSVLSAGVIRKILHEYQGCIIAVSHDRLFLKEVVTTLCEIKKHHIIALDKK